MSKRLATVYLLIGAAAMLLVVLPTVSSSAATVASPWWQILTGSRPTNLWEPVSQVQEITGSGIDTVNGTTVFILPGQTAAEVRTTLEGVYGAGNVEVTGGPVGTAPLIVTSIGADEKRWVPPIVGTSGPNATTLTIGGSGILVVTLTNLGDAAVDATSTPLKITDELPAGVIAYHVEGLGGVLGKAGSVHCELSSPTLTECTFEGELPSYEAIEVEIFANLQGTPPVAGAPGKVTVSGAANAPTKSASQAVRVSNAPVAYGFEHFSANAEKEGGKPVEQGGSHPFQWVNTVQFNSGAQVGPNRLPPWIVVGQPGLPRNTGIVLPPGLVGNATAVPTCPMSVFLARPPENNCPNETVIGVASVTIIEREIFGLIRIAVPIFNLPPQHGEPARFGFAPVGTPVIIDTSVDPDNEYRIKGEVRNAPQATEVLSATISLWGTPGDPRHDLARGWNCFLFNPEGYPGECEPPPVHNETPFLRMPVACDAPLEYPGETEPWNTPLGAMVSRETVFSPALLGCNQEPFSPDFSLAPTSKAAESSSGLDAEVSMPNAGLNNPSDEAVSETQFKKAEVMLPEGMTINPSEAEGLATCSPAEYARERFDSASGEGCPEASKIGSVKIKTPLLEEEAEGALYIATPHENPFGSLIAVYLVARIPDRGILVKQAGVVRPDSNTGRLVTIFDDVPQVPIDYFKLHFREGGRAPLVTPPHCGTYQTVARFTPWSAQDPDNPLPGEIVETTTPFTIESGVDGGACPAGGAPFNPGFEAGALNNNAATYSPFLMRLTRHDGDQDLTRFSAKLPPGMTANLSGVQQCSDAAIAAAKGKSGLEEKAHPSCPAGSQIGTVTGGAGVGSVLTYVDGKLYLAGPLNGAPLSVVAIVPAVAGPFDVGTVVTREALRIDPRTAEVEADGSSSDPLPHILAGIPLKVRDIRVNVDRNRFSLNPTSCEEMETRATIWSGGANVFSSADDAAHSLGARFQAADCRALGFKSKTGLRLRGGTRRGAFPALRLVYTPRPGRDANVEQFVLRFPHSEFIEQGHFRTICTRVQFAAGAGFGAECPKGSVYGHVKTWTPLLDEPLTGKVFLRSSNHNLPDVVLAMEGPASVPIKLEVPARIDSVHGGLRATASALPDDPISRVVLNMQGGQKGLFVNSRNICAGKNRATVSLTAHNGRTSTLRPLLRPTGCRKARKHRHHHRRASRR